MAKNYKKDIIDALAAYAKSVQKDADEQRMIADIGYLFVVF